MSASAVDRRPGFGGCCGAAGRGGVAERIMESNMASSRASFTSRSCCCSMKSVRLVFSLGTTGTGT